MSLETVNSARRPLRWTVATILILSGGVALALLVSMFFGRGAHSAGLIVAGLNITFVAVGVTWWIAERAIYQLELELKRLGEGGRSVEGDQMG